MDLAITPLSLILQAAKKIHEISQNVKANKKQCSILSERVRILTDLLEKLQELKHDLTNLTDCISQIKSCLNDCILFIIKFQNSRSWYKKIINHRNNEATFRELNDTLQKCISTLTLGLEVDSKVTRVLDRAEDLQAAAEDRAQIVAMRDVILQAHQAEQQRLQLLEQAREADRKIALEQHQAQMLQAEILRHKFESLNAHLLQMTKPPAVEPVLPVEKQLIIQIAEIDILQALADGDRATVYAGKFDEQDIAIKKLKHLTPQARAELFREATLLSRLKSDWVIKVYGVCIEENHECLIMELMEGGSLKDYLTRLDQPLSPTYIKQLALEIALGIQSLHRQRTIHRDLNPGNILLTRDGHAKIADFDLATMDTASMREIGSTSTTYEYMAPELLQLNPKATFASDIFSYGCILWALVTSKPPPLDKDSANFDDITEPYPQPYKQIIIKCWQSNSSNRISLEEIITIISEYHPPDLEALYLKGTEHEVAGRLRAAHECYLQSATLEFGRSEFRSGMFYLLGKGLGADKSKAYRYFKRAAKHRNRDQARACYNLGIMLEQGDGINKDLKDAYYWYIKALQLGFEDARARIAAIKEQAPDLDQNVEHESQRRDPLTPT